MVTKERLNAQYIYRYLKTYQQNHQKLKMKMANEILVQESMDTGEIFGVKYNVMKLYLRIVG